MTGCTCLEEVNAMLADRNTRIMIPLVLNPDAASRPMIVTEQIETGRGKKKASGMYASCCPFCGERYQPTPERKDQ